jgi:hypothetical protein
VLPFGADAPPALCQELVLTDMIGAGGFGAVWRGSWKKVTAAIKVRAARGGRPAAARRGFFPPNRPACCPTLPAP